MLQSILFQFPPQLFHSEQPKWALTGALISILYVLTWICFSNFDETIPKSVGVLKDKHNASNEQHLLLAVGNEMMVW